MEMQRSFLGTSRILCYNGIMSCNGSASVHRGYTPLRSGISVKLSLNTMTVHQVRHLCCLTCSPHVVIAFVIVPAQCLVGQFALTCCLGGFSSLFGALWDHLECLYISNCAPVMRADDLVHLSCFTKLVRLNLDSLRGPVEAQQLNYLGRLTSLQELRILFAGHGLDQHLLVGLVSCPMLSLP